MLREQTFSDRSNYAKAVDPEWLAKIAEHKEKVGFIDYDAPNAPKCKVPRTDAQLRELEGIERVKAEKKAQSENQAALARISNGTAVLRQKSDYNSAAPKPKAVRKVTISRPAKKVANVAKKAAKPAKKIKKLTDSQIASQKKRSENKLRRAAMTKLLKSGGAIQTIDWRGESLNDHQRQSYDLMMIGKKEDVSIVRINKVGTKKMQFIIDKFDRCNISKPISSLITGPDSVQLFEIVRSGQMLTIDDIKEDVVAGARAMAYLSRAYEIDIYSVVKSNKTVGWVMADAGELQVRIKHESEISDLGDMLDALDYLREKKVKESQ